MRVSLANGYGLCSTPIDVRDIDTIMECVWDPMENKWIVSYTYMKQLVESDVGGTKGNTLKDYTRLAKLVIKARNSEGLRLSEEDLFVKCTGMLSGSEQEMIEELCERDPDNRRVFCSIARRVPVDLQQESAWGRTPVRRCPVCYRGTPAGGVSCMVCYSCLLYTSDAADE